MCHFLVPTRCPSLTEPRGSNYGEEVIPIIGGYFAGRGLQPGGQHLVVKRSGAQYVVEVPGATPPA